MRTGSLTTLTLTNPIIDRINEAFNDGTLIECFQINNPDLLNIPMMNYELEQYFTNILTSEDIIKSLPELGIGNQLDCKTDFKWISPFTLDGSIAQEINFGGPYVRFNGTLREAKKLAQDFCDLCSGIDFLMLVSIILVILGVLGFAVLFGTALGLF